MDTYISYSTYFAPMRYRTVNLQPATYERLKQYQVGGRSLSEVIDELMDLAEPEEFYREALAIHRRRLKEMKRGGGRSLSQLERELATKD